MAGPTGDAGDGNALMQWFYDLLDQYWAGAHGKRSTQDRPEAARTNQTLGWSSWLFDEKRPHLIASEDGLMLNTGIMLIRAQSHSTHGGNRRLWSICCSFRLHWRM